MEERTSNLSAYHWYFIGGVLITLACGLLYPLAVYLTIPDHPEFVWLNLLHTPNYTIFYVVFLPLAAGILAASLSQLGMRKVGLGWILFWVFSQLLVAVNTGQDMLHKGPPLSALQVRTSEQNRVTLLQLEHDIRGCTAFCLRDVSKDLSDDSKLNQPIKESAPACDSLSRTAQEISGQPLRIATLGDCQALANKDPGHSRGAHDTYVTLAAQVLGVKPAEMKRFASFSDLGKRASGLTFLEGAMTFVAGAIVTTFFWYLLYLRVARRDALPHAKERVAIILLLLVTWIPLRLYGIWYANFYSLNGVIEGAIVVVVAMAFAALVLVVTIYRPGPIVHILSAIELVLGIMVSAIAYIHSGWLITAGSIVDNVGVGAFLTIETALFVTLGALAWSYLSPSTATPSP